MPLVILQAALGKPATTLTAPSPLWYRLLLVVVVLCLLEDAFFLLDLLGMLVRMKTLPVMSFFIAARDEIVFRSLERIGRTWEV